MDVQSSIFVPHCFYMHITHCICDILVQALDGSSPLYQVYSEHLSMATAFYTQLLPHLEDHYQLSVTSMDASQLKGMCTCLVKKPHD